MNISFDKLIVGRDWDWIYKHLPLSLSEDLRGIVAFDLDKQELCAAIVLYGWTQNSVMAHVVITNPMVLRHGLIEEFKRHVFDVCNLNLVIGVVPADNKKALKFDTHIGFKEVYRVVDGYEVGVDMVIMELRSGRKQQERHTEAA